MSLILNVKNTAKYLLRSYPLISSSLNEVERRYGLSVDESRWVDEKCFIQIFRKAYDESQFYRTLYMKHGVSKDDIKNIEDLTRLPVITKDDIRHNAEDILIGHKWQTMKAYTSGTTGKSLYIYQDMPSVWREQAYLYHYRRLCGFTYGEALVSLRGHLDSRQFSMRLPVGNILYLSSYQIRRENVFRYRDEIMKHKPKAIEGYPSSIYNLCCLFKEMGITIHIPLCFTSSETLFDYQRKLFHEILGCETYDWYGCTEKSIALVECGNHDGYYELPGYSINEYMDDGIITTSLINDCFPLIRYKVNDLIVPRSGYSASSITEPKIERLEGRTESYVITKNGTIVGRLNFLFKDIDNIRLAQIVQKESGKITINIVPEGEWSCDQSGKIMKYVDERIGLDQIDCTINIVTDADIIYTSRNKFNQVVRLNN